LRNQQVTLFCERDSAALTVFCLARIQSDAAPEQVVGKKEGCSRFDSFYWSFITATTVGYGDVRPTKTAPRILAIVIALVGLMLTGILVAAAVHSATVALAAHDAAMKVK
jgi:hypothetical protein